MDLLSRPIYLPPPWPAMTEAPAWWGMLLALLVLILPFSRLAYRGGRIVTWQRIVVQRWRGSPWVGWQAWVWQGVDFVRASWGMSVVVVLLRRKGGEEGLGVTLALALIGMLLVLWQAVMGAGRAGEYFAPAGFVVGFIWVLLGSPWLLALLIVGGLWLADWFRDWSAFFWAMAVMVIIAGPWFGHRLVELVPLALLIAGPALPALFCPVVLGLPAQLCSGPRRIEMGMGYRRKKNV